MADRTHAPNRRSTYFCAAERKGDKGLRGYVQLCLYMPHPQNMKLCIAYHSPGGNTRSLAFKLAHRLKEKEPVLIDLEIEPLPTDADLYLLGFGVRRNSCPMAVLDTLESLHGKRMLFFGTAALGTSEEYSARIRNQILAFLPEDAVMSGLWLSRGALSEEGRNYFLEQLSSGDHTEVYERMIRECYGHPDDKDADALWEFFRTFISEEK